MEGRKDEEMRQKRSSVVLELNGLAHTIKGYFAGISEKAAGGNQVWEGLSPANFGVIAFLWENRDRDIYQKDLEEQMKVQRSTISKMLQMMEKKGIVQRRPVDHDARLKKITLSEAVQDSIQSWMAGAGQMEQQATRGFSEEELDELIRLINKMKQNFT